jgi:signal transduction histidine kinase
MPPFVRYLGLALVPLLTFLAVAAAGQAWLQKETRRLQADAIAARRAQLAQALEITHRTPETWDESFQRELGALLGGTVTLFDSNDATVLPVSDAPPQTGMGVSSLSDGKSNFAGRALAPRGGLCFDYPLPGTTGFHARIAFAEPATHQLIVLHEQMLAAIVVLALALIAVSAILSFYHRPASDADSLAPGFSTRSEMLGVEHFARISVERSEALKREMGARHRAEEDLQVSRTLLDRSLQTQVQLGRDLHDNICQTLYAVSLSLEAVRRTIAGEGAATTGLRLDQCIAELRRLNHEVRSYLKDLEPDAVRHMPFMEAIEVMLDGQSTPSGPKLVLDLEPDVADFLAPDQAAEVVSILREAVSNSIRHGGARTITLQARRDEESAVFAVQDDGQGFDLAASTGQGHGRANMQARAAAMGGSLKVTSVPEKGTRVLLTLPIDPKTQNANVEIRDKSEA